MAPEEEPVSTVDLGGLGGTRAEEAALAALIDLEPGGVLDLVHDEEPMLLMMNLNGRLQRRLHWEVIGAGPPLWRVRVRYRQDVAPADVIDLLTHGHERLDALFAEAMRHRSHRQAAEARESLRAFVAELRRHLDTENELLAPQLNGAGAALDTMLREHREILQYLEELEPLLAEGNNLEGAGADALLGRIASSLTRHDAREEQSLFPRWAHSLARMEPDKRGELFAEVAERLGREK